MVADEIINVLDDKKLLHPYLHDEWRCIGKFYSNYIENKNNKKNKLNINMNKNLCDDKIDLFINENLSTMFQSFYKNFCGEKKIIVNEKPNRQKIKFILDNEKKIKNLGFDKVIEDCITYKKILKNFSSYMVEYKDNKNIRMKMNPTKNSTTMTKKLRQFLQYL